MVLHEGARRVLAETRQTPLPLLEFRLHQAEVPPRIHVGRLAPRALRVLKANEDNKEKKTTTHEANDAKRMTTTQEE